MYRWWASEEDEVIWYQLVSRLSLRRLLDRPGRLRRLIVMSLRELANEKFFRNFYC